MADHSPPPPDSDPAAPLSDAQHSAAPRSADAPLAASPLAAAPLPANVRLLGWASLLNDTASDMIYPLLPLFLKQTLGATAAHLGWIEGVSETTSSVLKLFAGGWSDNAGRRRAFVVWGYVIAALSRPLTAFSQGPWSVLAIRLSDRVGKGIRSAPRDAMLSECTSPSQRGRAFGFHRAMDHAGAMLGPALAAIFLYFFPGEYRWLFGLAVIPGALVFVLLGLFLHEPAKIERRAPPVVFSLRPFDGRFRVYLVALLLFTLGNASDAFLLSRASELGVAPVWLPILWMAFHLVKSVGNLLAGRAVDRIGARPMIQGGWLLYAVIYGMFGWASETWQVWALFLGYGLFYALTEPAEKTLVANLVGVERQGLAFGWFHLTIGVGALPANVFFGWIYFWYGPQLAFGVGAGLALTASLLLATVGGKTSR